MKHGKVLPEGTGGILRWAFVLFTAVAGLWFVVRVWSVVIPFILALVITYLLEPLVAALERRRIPRLLAILGIYAVLAGVVVTGLVFLVPAIVEELNRLAEALPRYTQQVQEIGRAIELAPDRTPMPESVRAALDQAIDRLELAGIRAINSLVTGILGALSSALSLLLAPVLAFYFLLDLEKIKAGFIRLLPSAIRQETLVLLAEIDIVLGGFIRGQLTLALIVGVMVTVALSILGLRFVIIFGVFAGLMEFIPYFGPFIGGIPPVLLGALRSPWLGLKVAIAFILIQQIESIVIVPRVMGKNVGLHPLAVIFALMAGGYLYGFWGLLLAVPAAGIIRVVVGFCYQRLVS